MTFEQSCITYIDAVKSLFKRHNFDAKFYVAGGSVFAAYIGHDNYTDIDVYFYNDDDLHRFEQSLSSVTSELTVDKPFKKDIGKLDYSYSPNAINFYEDPKVIQVIKMHTGEPTDIFKTYDINCSQIAFTSDHDVIIGDQFSTDIKVFTDRLTIVSISRYDKYTKRKGATDKDGKTLKSVIDEIFNAPFATLRQTYESSEKQPACTLLNSEFDDKYKPYIREKFNALSGYDKLKMFKTSHLNTPIFECVEQYVYRIICGEKIDTKMVQKYDQIAKTIYPEYFI